MSETPQAETLLPCCSTGSVHGSGRTHGEPGVTLLTPQGAQRVPGVTLLTLRIHRDPGVTLRTLREHPETLGSLCGHLREHRETLGSLCQHLQAALSGDTSPGCSLAGGVFC